MYYFSIFIYFLFSFLFTIIFSLNLNNTVRKYVFSILSLFLILITSAHPFDYSVDDKQYSFIAQNILDNNISFLDSINHDYLYFIFLKISLYVFPFWISFIIISIVALLLKLFVIAKLTNYSILSLFIYFTLFFELHDLTQFRVSLAVSFFYVAFYVIVSYKSFLKSLLFFTFSGLSHFQAIPGFFIPIISKILKNRFYLIFFSTLVFYFISNFSIFNLLEYFGYSVELFRATFDQSNLLEISKYNSYNFLIILLLFLLIKYLNNSINSKNFILYKLSFYSILFGFILSTVLSGIGQESRIIQFFFTPIVFLIPLVFSDKKMYLTFTLIGIISFLWFGHIYKLFI